MKTRQGFVSNSSSSSFMLYGAYVGNSKRMGEALERAFGMEYLTKWYQENLPTDEVPEMSDIVDLMHEMSCECSSLEIPELDKFGVGIMSYDDLYFGFDVYVGRDTLLKGFGYTEQDIAEMDELFAKLGLQRPDVHSGEYYC